MVYCYNDHNETIFNQRKNELYFNTFALQLISPLKSNNYINVPFAWLFMMYSIYDQLFLLFDQLIIIIYFSMVGHGNQQIGIVGLQSTCSGGNTADWLLKKAFHKFCANHC